MKFLVLAALVLAAAPASAYLDLVVAPGSAETGEPIQLWVIVGLPDSCWEFAGYAVTVAGLEAVVDIDTRYGDGPGGCLPVIEPYEFFPEIVCDRPGTWTLRVVEHPVRDSEILPVHTWEGTLEVTGTVPDVRTPWGGVKARYR